MNACIPSEQRATVLSFNSLMGSAGGVVAQPALGRVADVYSFGTAYVVAGVLYAIRLPFVVAVRRMGSAGRHRHPRRADNRALTSGIMGAVAEQESTRDRPDGPRHHPGDHHRRPGVAGRADIGIWLITDHGHLRIGADGAASRDSARCFRWWLRRHGDDDEGVS